MESHARTAPAAATTATAAGAATNPAAPPARSTTPAGGQVNADWGQLKEAIDCYAVLLAGALTPGNTASHVVFRCGTIVRVAGDDPEFGGYAGAKYKFPDHRLEDASTVAEIMADNARVWEAQRVIPGAAGRAIRQAFERLISQGYPYPGGPPADRSPVQTGISSDALGEFWLVYWPNLDEGGHVHNMAFSKKGPLAAACVGGELRRYDYMFPEVAAVFTPDMMAWTYGPDGKFGVHE